MRLENEGLIGERGGTKKTIHWRANEDQPTKRKLITNTWAEEIGNTLWLWEKGTS